MKFNENTRVKIPAILHLEKLGYKYLSLKDLTWDKETNIVKDIFFESLQRINPTKSVSEIEIFAKQVIASLDNDDLGKMFYSHLINQSGIRLIDFDNFANNTLNCVTEYEYENDLESFRPDISVLVNGMPLVFIEVKKPNNKEGILAERNRINMRFKNRKFKQILNLTQFMIFSNNMEYDDDDSETYQGAFYASGSLKNVRFNFFREEEFDFLNPELFKYDPQTDFVLHDTNCVTIKHTSEFLTNCDPRTPTNRIITSMLHPSRFAFLLKFGFAYVETYEGIEKHIMRYPQLFATQKIRSALEAGKKSGIIWHTQGSGKTALAFHNVKFLTEYFQSKGQIAKIYFVVDRLNLLKQAKTEFQMRGLKVNTINSKSEFLTDFTKNQAISNFSGQLEITVINIQKFAEEASELFDNSYALNIQRIYFIDEAHRSYKPQGSFFANLRSSDREAILICLTGTPLLGNEPSKKLFGDYIHKYYYNRSIADGYTLRLIREDIEASFSTKLKQTLDDLEEVQKGTVPRKLILSHKSFVTPMLSYIIADLVKSRNAHNDNSLGGMIVCDSSEQAKEMSKIFADICPAGMKAALILHDEGTKEDRDDLAESFKEGVIDFLIVYNMLLTGFDAPRLKKIYLGRVVRDHNLLQTLTRVNRPYSNFKYGYVVDFAGITEEFRATNAAYFAELQEDLGSEIVNYSNLFVSEKEIEENILKIQNDLFIYDLTNAEVFSRQISSIQDRHTMREIIKSLSLARDSFNMIRALGYKELANRVDFEKLKFLLIEAVNHLELLMLKDRIDITEDTKELLNLALENIQFTFQKVGEEELEIGNKLRNTIRQVREVLARNFDEKDPEFVKLYEELKRILEKRNIEELSNVDVQATISQLEHLFREANRLNQNNYNMARKYGGDEKFARLHKSLGRTNTQLTDIDIFNLINPVRLELNNLISNNSEILNNNDYFEMEIARLLSISFDKNPKYEMCVEFDTLKIQIADEYFSELERMVA